MKKTIAFAAAALVTVAAAANAQTAYEVMSTSTTETLGDTTTNVQTNYVSTTTVMPDAIGDAPATPAVTAASTVSVKLPSGDVVAIPDSDDAPWNKDARLQGYDRFTFDPVNNVFVAGKGDDKFANNWDDNGNRVQKAAPAPAKKKVAAKKKAAAKVEAPAADASAPAADTTAPAETQAPSSDAAPADAGSGDEEAPAAPSAH